MHNLNQNLKQRILNSFNKKLKSLLDDIVIKDKKIFVTIEANNNKDAEKLAVHKKESEEILKKNNLFDEIWVTYNEKENKVKIKLEIKDNIDYIVIELVDNGIGIDDTTKRMTPYFTTKKNGTGLGLPIVSKIINEHLGEINIYNLKDSGVKVRINLPKKK